MQYDQIAHESQQKDANAPIRVETFLPHLRAYLTAMPEIRLAYFHSGPQDEQLRLSGPDHARVVLHFARSVSKEHTRKRIEKIQRHFAPVANGDVEYLDIEQLDYRDACEVAFNAVPVFGTVEVIERDRLYRYNVFLEWNAGKKLSGMKQDLPPILSLRLDRPVRVQSIERFIAPIHRHLKLIDGHLRELRRLVSVGMNEFTADSTAKSLAESYILKAIQSAILITMSIMHRSMRLSARDYRDLFLLMPVYGMTDRERAGRLAKCAELRDRLMFLYEQVTPLEVYEQALEVTEALQDFKSYMLVWMFDHYYGTTGELIQSE